MSNINVKIDTGEVEKTSDVTALCRRSELIISNQPEYENASSILSEVKKRYKELEAQRKEIVKPLDEAKKKIQDLFRTPLDLLSNAESKIKSLMIGYTEEQERIAREEQMKLQEIADKETARQKKILDEKIARAEASGKTEKAEALALEKEMVVPIITPVIAPNIEKPKGVSYRDKFTAEVVDFKLLPDEYKLPNQSALDKVAQATKGSISIPGVKIKSEKILASR